ncbi:hypothetical protein FKW77_007754 [Venturia effusa]|uniref:VIT domain-containing protein n=1 Tax=Venturia effusa TaxID=50376 RepID=A0A517L5U2_9PEZI|nr:hypothetical protein FKW77_007754 [Venturia effusa]
MHPHGHLCGCYYLLPQDYYAPKRVYLSQVAVKAHTTILETTSRTLLTQTFTNPSTTKGIKQIRYTFPLYDGVSVVGFKCTVGDRVIEGEVKEKEKARAVYKDAVSKGQSAGLLEEIPDASDVFMTFIGNVPPGGTVVVDIIYLGELKHDAEIDGVRFTIPTTIAPRYGDYPAALVGGYKEATLGAGFEVTVDAVLSHGSFVQQISSPSHPIAVSLGRTSANVEADPASNRASATLSLGSAALDKDFVIQVVSKEIGIPKAVLEAHPSIPGQRALMATLVPQFHLPPERPEIVFICDRSGSMAGSSIRALKKALKVFLKSLPVGVKFNVCSFGSRFSFLWPESQSYSQTTLEEAMSHVEQFDANFGGTEMYGPVEATLRQRFTDMNLEIFLVTDGEVWNQDRLFALLNTEIGVKKAPIRVFSLGIGNTFSSALIEGLARTGNGFSQVVTSTEKCASKVVRMLKGALSPHINDYTLEVKYGGSQDDGFEIIEKVADSLKVGLTMSNKKVSSSSGDESMKTISLFDPSTTTNTAAEPDNDNDDDGQARYAHLPIVEAPRMLQAPNVIPSLFPFSRTTVYLLMSPETIRETPTSVILRATSAHGPLKLEIPVDVLEQPGETIHQLAARKAIVDLQEGYPQESRGWLVDARDSSNVLIKEKYPGRFPEMLEREAVRLGVQFQIGSRWCSFVAVEKKAASKDKDEEMEDWECLDDGTSEPSSPVPPPPPASLQPAPITSMKSSMVMPRQRLGSPMMDLFSMASSQSQRVGNYGNSGPPSAGITASRSTQHSHFRSQRSRPMAEILPYDAPTDRIAGRRYAANAPVRSTNSGDFQTDSRLGFQEEECEKSDSNDDMVSSALAPPIVPLTSFASAAACATESSEDESSSDENMNFGYSLRPGVSPRTYKKKEKKKAKPVEPLHSLISLQNFEGYWILDTQFCHVIGLDLDKVKAAVAKLTVDEKWLATALAVRFFLEKLSKEKDTWELVVEKAKAWLEAQGCGEENSVWTVDELDL